MAQILVRQLDDATLEAVKSRAKANNRSAEAEVRDIISRAVEMPAAVAAKPKMRLSELVGSVPSARSSAQIVEELRALRDEWAD